MGRKKFPFLRFDHLIPRGESDKEATAAAAPFESKKTFPYH